MYLTTITQWAAVLPSMKSSRDKGLEVTPGGTSFTCREVLRMPAEVNTGDRRTSLSALVQLQAGMNVSDAFPIYPVPQGYRDPLASGNAAVRQAAQAAENEITPKVVMQYLENLTTSFPTRSATNSTATEQVETWLRGLCCVEWFCVVQFCSSLGVPHWKHDKAISHT